MSLSSRLTRPQGMNESLFKTCSDWATRMDQAVHQEGPVPMDEVPLLYDMFRRANPDALDPVFARSLQRHQRELRLVQQLRDANIPIPAPPPPAPSAVAMVPLLAIELMLANTKSILGTVQRDARWQLQSALRAVGRSAPPPHAPPMRGYRRRNWNRRYQEHDRTLPELNDFLASFINSFDAEYAPRPRNSMRRGPNYHTPAGPRPHDRRRQAGGPPSEGGPPSYRRNHEHECLHPPHTPAGHSARDATPHPRAGVLFRDDEDFIMREATPYDDTLSQPEAPAPAAVTFDLHTLEPPITISDSGSHGTATPRAASPAPSAQCTSTDREVYAYLPHAVMSAFPADVCIVAAGFPEDSNPPATEPVAGSSEATGSGRTVLANASVNLEAGGNMVHTTDDLGMGSGRLSQRMRPTQCCPLANAGKSTVVGLHLLEYYTDIDAT
ncbi:hypothetical protein AURDEDRAFT_120067 [Auricularia subglabra TFB-10046 SS5]|nr:hypothetical protein AURDEDRAFT_120067 [Auricularia subglabra TFB-10046 SS5]